MSGVGVGLAINRRQLRDLMEEEKSGCCNFSLFAIVKFVCVLCFIPEPGRAGDFIMYGISFSICQMFIMQIFDTT